MYAAVCFRMLAGAAKGAVREWVVHLPGAPGVLVHWLARTKLPWSVRSGVA